MDCIVSHAVGSLWRVYPVHEASLRGHLKAGGDEQTGSQSYIPPDPKDDKALHTALDLIRGIQKNSAYPPNPKTVAPNKVALSPTEHGASQMRQ
jgi:hypothetical protein